MLDYYSNFLEYSDSKGKCIEIFQVIRDITPEVYCLSRCKKVLLLLLLLLLLIFCYPVDFHHRFLCIIR